MACHDAYSQTLAHMCGLLCRQCHVQVIIAHSLPLEYMLCPQVRCSSLDITQFCTGQLTISVYVWTQHDFPNLCPCMNMYRPAQLRVMFCYLPSCLDTRSMNSSDREVSKTCGELDSISKYNKLHKLKLYQHLNATNVLSFVSPCRKCMWYQLLLPSSVNISSFTYISKIFYALLTTSSEVGAKS